MESKVQCWQSFKMEFRMVQQGLETLHNYSLSYLQKAVRRSQKYLLNRQAARMTLCVALI